MRRGWWEDVQELHLAVEGLLAVWLGAAQILQASLCHMQAAELPDAVLAVCMVAAAGPHKACSRQVIHAYAARMLSLHRLKTSTLSEFARRSAFA